MASKAKIEKLVLDLNGKEVALTIEQAKQLFSALDELFGKKETVVKHNHDYHLRQYPWTWSQVTPSWTSQGGTNIKYQASDSSIHCSLK